MEINPGGYIDPSEIIGREAEIERYWQILRRQSLILNAERRIGKTLLLRKMGATGREQVSTFYQELERVHSIIELISQIYRVVAKELPRARWLRSHALKAWIAMSEQRIEKLSLPSASNNWKALLEIAVADVLSLSERGTVVFMWDEFPLMLYNVRQREGADHTIQLLDHLRHLRQTHGARLRFLFTGSIGLHLVLRKLRIEGNANAPFNDVHTELVPPLSPQDSHALTAGLCAALRHRPVDVSGICDVVAIKLGGFAYHIQHCFDLLDQLDRPASSGDIESVIDALASNPSDPAHLAYTQHRIQTYYSPEESGVALAILDVLAAQDLVGLVELVNLVRHTIPEVTAHQVRDVLELLRQDQCVTRTLDGRFGFCWLLIKLNWKSRRS